MPRLFKLLLCLSVVIPACGGGESRPGPLTVRLPDKHLVQVPIEERQQAIAAKEAYNRAELVKDKAQADLAQANTDLQVAENEQQAAALAEDSANKRKKDAEESGDINRDNAATLALRAARLGRQAADKKVEYMKTRVAYLKKEIIYAEDQMYDKEAQWELAKARVARAKGIQPKDFNYPEFETQSDSRSRQVQVSKPEVDRARNEMLNREREWKDLVRQADEAKGSLGGSS